MVPTLFRTSVQSQGIDLESFGVSPSIWEVFETGQLGSRRRDALEITGVRAAPPQGMAVAEAESECGN